ncbi:hypothetical protein RhiirA5_425085 [Rhizophagus irregularis]|uniref:Uncharacterized protein n=1 Tax=Rhizophagus irregularis TaxID=588596 RepID=A0A2N0S3W8_9GLOM|nr:hypothetical protein RhiirA5_425085 [Rhizophagus irregularis]PKC70251.1 hypothetical protein RhiirA1_455025 [Rhizophagus irregularis]CAB4494060.1 unnamed protein product [Rhizophagus irregularis]CAB5203334.1 unnamed protein product [Rhizophagus irregularis]
MQSNHTQIRSNVETFQDNRITPYSDETERIECSNSDSQDYNTVYQHIDESHLGVNFSGSQDYNNVQDPVYQQSHSYMNDRISTEQIGNGNYQDYVRTQHADNIRMDDALDANDYNAITVEQASHGNYQDYHTVKAPTHQQSQLDNTADRQFFFFNDVYVYDVKCEEIPFDIVVKTLNKSLINKENMQINENEIMFFYANQYTNRSYKLTCKIVSPFSIAKYLNKNIYGIEIQANVERELLKLTPEQKQNLEFHLFQYLDNYLII